MLYRDRRIFGADLDSERIATARAKLLDADEAADPVALRRTRGEIIVADCDQWPFPDLAYGMDDEIAVADFDSYAYPYASFRAFWDQAPRTDPLVCFFTDGERQPLMRTGGHYIAPDGEHAFVADIQERRKIFNSYLSRHVWPWLEEYVWPWRVVHRFRYLRGWMAYHGVVLSRSPGLA